MCRFILPAVATAALALAAPAPAKAQVIVGYPSYSYSGGYPSYYGGIRPIGEGGLIQFGLNLALNYLGGYGSYGYSPGYYGGYYPGYYSPAYSGVYTYPRYYGGYYPSYYGGWSGYRPYSYPVYTGNWGGKGYGKGWKGGRGGKWRR